MRKLMFVCVIFCASIIMYAHNNDDDGWFGHDHDDMHHQGMMHNENTSAKRNMHKDRGNYMQGQMMGGHCSVGQDYNFLGNIDIEESKKVLIKKKIEEYKKLHLELMKKIDKEWKLLNAEYEKEDLSEKTINSKINKITALSQKKMKSMLNLRKEIFKMLSPAERKKMIHKVGDHSHFMGSGMGFHHHNMQNVKGKPPIHGNRPCH